MLVTWKLRASPRRLIAIRLRARDVLAVEAGSSPRVGAKRPLIRLNSVDLPAPFGPMIAWRSPLRNVERDAADDRRRAEALLHAAKLQRAGASSRSPPRGRVPTPRPTTGHVAPKQQEAADERCRRDDPRPRRCGIDRRPQEAHPRAELRLRREAVAHLDQQDGAGGHHRDRHERERIRAQDAAERARARRSADACRISPARPAGANRIIAMKKRPRYSSHADV